MRRPNAILLEINNALFWPISVLIVPWIFYPDYPNKQLTFVFYFVAAACAILGPICKWGCLIPLSFLGPLLLGLLVVPFEAGIPYYRGFEYIFTLAGFLLGATFGLLIELFCLSKKKRKNDNGNSNSELAA